MYVLLQPMAVAVVAGPYFLACGLWSLISYNRLSRYCFLHRDPRLPSTSLGTLIPLIYIDSTLYAPLSVLYRCRVAESPGPSGRKPSLVLYRSKHGGRPTRLDSPSGDPVLWMLVSRGCQRLRETRPGSPTYVPLDLSTESPSIFGRCCSREYTVPWVCKMNE
jgi:hypothetical protein